MSSILLRDSFISDHKIKSFKLVKILRLCLGVLRERKGNVKEGRGRKGREWIKEGNHSLVWELKNQQGRT
jgi:hypothetical protein